MKKIWSLFLTVCMVSALFGSIPVTVNAETNGTDNSLIISKDSFSVLNDSVESGENSTTVISNNLQNDNVFAEGDGTAENPYQVATPEQLNEVRNYLSAYFIQICDIDMTEATSENGIYYNFGSGWVPIGDDTSPFTGTYNGDEHKIIGLKSNQIGTSQEYAGLFGNNKGVICNLGMVDNYIIGNRRYIGSIAGRNSGNIENCYNTGIISASPNGDCHTSYVGGIVGLNGGNVKKCYNAGTITSSVSPSSERAGMMPTVSAAAGGIVGSDNSGTIENCCNTGTVTSFGSYSYKPSDSSFRPYLSSYAGGIVGEGDSLSKSIKYCCNMGVVSAKSSASIPGDSSYADNSNSYAGGIAGLYAAAMENCYNTGEITAETDKGSSIYDHNGNSYAGGITGWSKYIAMKDCYNTGKVVASVIDAHSSDHAYAGGISGILPVGIIENSYNIGNVTTLSNAGHICASGIVADRRSSEGSGSVIDCYYYDDPNFKAIAGTPLSLEELKQQDSYVGFDFEMVWDISLNVNDGFPSLRNMPEPLCIHVWGAWSITKQPTQTETGTAERVCQNNSSHKDQKELPVLTDTTVWIKGDYQAPTCEADGYQKYTSDYGEVTETIPATDHSWGAWEITKQPTQTETGTAERVCKNDSSHKEQKDLPVLTDTATWTKGEYQAPTCEADGYQKYTSQYGEVTETIPATDHNWGTWTITKQPTQTETGTAERVCQNDSSHKDTVTLPVLTDASVWTAGERVEPTCTADGSQAYTSDYGTVTEPLPATDHTFEWVIDRPATTEAPGIKHEECTKCHEKRNENTEIPQLPAESYAVHYDANGGSGTMPDGAAPKGKEFTLPENAFTPPEGKQFKCWAIGSIDGAQIQPGAGFTFMENTTVYAVWENIGFTITFDKNGGSSVSAETMVTNPDGKLSELPTAERSGRYRFKGWYTAKSGGTEVTKETVFTEDTTVYAQWTYTGGGSSGGGGGGGISVTRYTVTFDTQGGSEVESVRVTRNSTVTKPADPVREGYTFEGWFTDQECSAAYDFDTKVTKNITLYAKWTEEQPEEPTDPTKPESPDDWENPFDDVDEGDWFYDDVKTAYENGWFTGVTNTSFAPNEAITRGMMVTVLYRAENEPTTADKSKFEDVAPDAYYTKAVIWAENNGIVKGYSEVEFAPDKLISREEMAAIMHRYAGYKGADTGVIGDLMKFADQAQIADWARENVAWAVGYGLLSGKDNNLLDPQGHTTRAETAAILNRFLKK